MILKGSVRHGDILWVDFDPSVGHEFKSKRPGLVVESNRRLQKTNLVTIIPLTSNLRNKIEGDVFVPKNEHNKLLSDSIAKIGCLMSLDYSRFIRKIGSIDRSIVETIKASMKEHFDMS